VKAKLPVHLNSESNAFVCMQYSLRNALVGLQYISLLLVTFALAKR